MSSVYAATGMQNLADYLGDRVRESSFRDVAAHTGVGKTTLDDIIKRRITTLPKIATLRKIADAYQLTLPTVVQMAGESIGDGDRFVRFARELEATPHIVDRFDELVSLSPSEFDEALDYIAYRRRQRDQN